MVAQTCADARLRLHFGAARRAVLAQRGRRQAIEPGRGPGLTRIGLLDRADDAAGNLPYGDQRRLEIARAMCTDRRCSASTTGAGLNARESAALSELLPFDPRRARNLDPADRA